MWVVTGCFLLLGVCGPRGWLYCGNPRLEPTFLTSSCCCSVIKSCPTLWDPTDCSMSVFPVFHNLPEFAQKHVIESVMLSKHLIFCCPLLLLPSIFPSIRVFPMSWLFASGGQSIGASASASVLPMNIQGWFPLVWTGLILQSKGLSRVFSSTTVRKHQFFSAQPFLWSNSHNYTRLLEKP